MIYCYDNNPDLPCSCHDLQNHSRLRDLLESHTQLWPEHPEQTNCSNAKSPISGQHLPDHGMLLSSLPAREGFHDVSSSYEYWIVLVLLHTLTFPGCSDPPKCLPCAQEPWKLQLLILARTWPSGRRCEWLRLHDTRKLSREKERERATLIHVNLCLGFEVLARVTTSQPVLLGTPCDHRP